QIVEPGGQLFLMCFSDEEPGADGPRRVSRQELYEAFADGWQVESIQPAQFEVNPAFTEIKFSEGGPKAWFAIIRREWGILDKGAIANLPLPPLTQPVTILDLGSSEGRNAIYMMANIAEGINRRTSQPVQMIFSDLATNNFNKLFANLQNAGDDGLFPPRVYPCV